MKQHDLFFDLSDRVKLRLSGPDRLRFFNGQITSDARKATDTRVMEACLLDAKGKMNAHIFFFASADSFLLDADRALAETLMPRIERYVIADDVAVENVTEQFSIFHVFAASVPKLPTAKWILAAQRFRNSGWDIWIDSKNGAQIRGELEKEYSFCDSACAEALRIEQGLPRWGFELTSEIIPVETDLEERAIDYEKGCYVGQEVISRMKMSGQKNKRLRGLVSASGQPLSAGMHLFAEPGGGKGAGWISSAVHSKALGKEIGLGFVRRGFDKAGKQLFAAKDGAQPPESLPVDIVDLPFRQ